MERKNGASFRVFAGSIGFFRCLIMSRFCRLDHLDFGSMDRVTKPSARGVHFSETSSIVSLFSFLCVFDLTSVSSCSVSLVVGRSVKVGLVFSDSGRSET